MFREISVLFIDFDSSGFTPKINTKLDHWFLFPFFKSDWPLSLPKGLFDF